MALGRRPLPLAGATAASTAPDMPWLTPFGVPSIRHQTAHSWLAWNPNTPPPVTPTSDKFVVPFSEPRRFRLGLRAANQQFFTIDPTALIEPEPITEDKWHRSWSEPKRFKLDWRPYGQHAFFTSPRMGPVTEYVAMAAVETGDSLAGTVRVKSVLIQAEVSIVEIVAPRYAHVSIIQRGNLGG